MLLHLRLVAVAIRRDIIVHTTCRGKVKSVKAAAAHEDFEDALKKLEPSDGILKLYKQILIREAASGLRNLNSRISSLRLQLDDLDSTRLGILQKFAENSITLEDKTQLLDAQDNKKLEVALWEQHFLEPNFYFDVGVAPLFGYIRHNVYR